MVTDYSPAFLFALSIYGESPQRGYNEKPGLTCKMQGRILPPLPISRDNYWYYGKEVDSLHYRAYKDSAVMYP